MSNEILLGVVVPLCCGAGTFLVMLIFTVLPAKRDARQMSQVIDELVRRSDAAKGDG